MDIARQLHIYHFEPQFQGRNGKLVVSKDIPEMPVDAFTVRESKLIKEGIEDYDFITYNDSKSIKASLAA